MNAANTVILMGRLTADPDVRYTQGENPTSVARYTLAVDKVKNGNHEADFIRCVAWGKAAEFAQKYLSKGMKIAIAGELHTGSYTNKEGQKANTVDVYVDSHTFCESRQTAQQTAPQAQPNNYSSYGGQIGYGRAQSAGQPMPPQPDGQQEYGQQSFVGDGFEPIPGDVNDPGLPFN